MYKALDVAEYVRYKEKENGRTISNLKLQKILYFIQAEFLVKNGIPCFEDDIVAWGFGPVVLNVYNKFKIFGSSGIPDMNIKEHYNILNRDKEIINVVLKELRKYNSTQLTDITLKQGPWLNSYVKGFDAVISKELIKKYFSEE